MVWDAISRPLFVLGMMLVLLPTFEGRLSWLKIFMSLGLFQIIGKLTYTSYLIHINIMSAYSLSRSGTTSYSRDGTAYKFFGIYILSYIAAYFLSVLSEWPFLNIEKLILFPPSKPAAVKEQNLEKYFLEKDDEVSD